MTDVIVHVASIDRFFDEAAAAASRIDAGDRTPQTPRRGFETAQQLFETLTGDRWRILERLRRSGPVTLADLALAERRDIEAVRRDIEPLLAVDLVEAGENSRLRVPWSKITVELDLQSAA